MLCLNCKMAWSESETPYLIHLWGEESIQVQIEGCKRNKQIFAKLAGQMEEEGSERTGSQCREKVKKLRGDYRKIKDNNNESGRVRRSSKIFEAKDRILGHKPAIHPSVVVDRLSQTIVEGSEYTHAEAIDVPILTIPLMLIFTLTKALVQEVRLYDDPAQFALCHHC